VREREVAEPGDECAVQAIAGSALHLEQLEPKGPPGRVELAVFGSEGTHQFCHAGVAPAGGGAKHRWKKIAFLGLTVVGAVKVIDERTCSQARAFVASVREQVLLEAFDQRAAHLAAQVIRLHPLDAVRALA